MIFLPMVKSKRIFIQLMNHISITSCLHSTFINIPPGKSLKSFPPLVYHEEYSCPWPADHRFPMNKFVTLRDTLRNSGIFTGEFHTPINPLDNEDSLQYLYAAHDKSYIDRFINNQFTDLEKRKIGLEFNSYLVRRTFSEVGGTMLAIDLCLEKRMALNLAGGTHHAYKNYGSGFTIINDLAVAAYYSILKKGCQRILIFDCDVHQGDGTASIFTNESKVFTVSIHCEVNFPFKKQQSSLDISLPAGTADEEYIEAMMTAFHQAIECFQPDLIIYDAGVDISCHDVLGKLKVTDIGIYRRDYWVLNECVSLGIPVCGVIGGGYDRDIYKLAARHSLLHIAGIEVWKNHRLC